MLKLGIMVSENQFTFHYSSPLGGITLASDGEKLIGLWFDEQKYFAAGLSKNAEQRELPVFEETKSWLDIYFNGREPNFIPPLKLQGSDFRKAVWEILLTIPYGKTITYGEIASRLTCERGLDKMSAQAVGGAVGHNPVSLIVPCHRVVGTGGSLTGYAGGIEKKIRLLKLEDADMNGLFIPKSSTAK